MNLRPSGYEPDELPDCSIPRYPIFVLDFSSKADNRTRTDNLLITNQLLCQLSHIGRLPDWQVGGGGFEPPKQCAADLQSVPFGHSGNHPQRQERSLLTILYYSISPGVRQEIFLPLPGGLFGIFRAISPRIFSPDHKRAIAQSLFSLCTWKKDSRKPAFC